MANLIEIVVKAKDEAESVMRASEKTSQDLGKTMTKVGLASGLALAGIGFEAVKMAGSYETATTRLVTSAGESTANIDMVRKGMLAMAGQVGISAEELAKGMYTVESAGFHGADGLLVLKAAAEGAKAEGADLGTVTNAVTDILVDYHMKASQAADATSMLITAVAHGKTSFEELSGSMHNVLPLASAMGLSLSDVLGVLAEMTAHGMSADQASQNLANAMRSLVAPTQVMQKEFKALGTSTAEVHQILGSQGLAATLEFLNQKAKQVSPNLLEQDAAMKKLIGTAPGLQAALMTTGENYSATTAAIKDISGATADAQGNVKGFAEVQQTLGQQVAELKAGFGSLMIELGDKLIPVLKDVVGWMNRNHDAVLAIIGVLAAAAAAAFAYTAVVKAAAVVTGIVSVATKGWELAQKAMNAAATQTVLTLEQMNVIMAGLGVATVALAAVDLGQWLGKLAGVGDHTNLSLTDLTATFLDAAAGSATAAKNIGDMADTLMVASQKANDNKPVQGLKDMDQALADLVSSGHADQARAAVNSVTAALQQQGVSLGYIHDQVLPKYNEALQGQANQAKLAADQTSGLAGDTAALASAQQGATDSVGAATSAYDAAKKAASGYLDSVTALYGKFGDLSDAQAAFTIAMSDATKKITDGKDAVNLNTVAGANNVQEFEKLSKAAQDVAQKLYEQTGSSDQATVSLRNSATAIDALALKSGLTKTQVAELNTELFGIPDVKNIVINADTDPAAIRLAALAGQIAGISAQVGQLNRGGNAAMGRATGGEVGGAATGGDRSGLVWVGEQGPELVRLPSGSTVRSNPDSMAALGGGGSSPMSVQLEWVGPEGDELFTVIKRWIRARFGNDPNSVQKALGQAW